ncbi:hypothetical protein [Leucobacter japonicus]|uniref:hypothetical protein n=1 Tax=Leucobacter japonicus TaxID=1461259 RepID=UPI0006A7B206|nr:hypothetical protein [Leucobacter japonicus]
MVNQETLRERVIDALSMSPLSDYAGTSMGPINRTADMILEVLSTPVQGGATEEQIEAAARAIYELDPWAAGGDRQFSENPMRAWEELLPGDRADYARVATAALSASASADPADEHHDAEGIVAQIKNRRAFSVYGEGQANEDIGALLAIVDGQIGNDQ